MITIFLYVTAAAMVLSVAGLHAEKAIADRRSNVANQSLRLAAGGNESTSGATSTSLPATGVPLKSADSSSVADAKLAPRDIPRFGMLEQTFTQQRSYANPYVEVTANATFIQPGGRQHSIPLFWDGGTKWKVRFSPDVIGAWSWSVSSSDPGLNGVKGSFNCVPSMNRGGVMAMKGYSYHFQYQDGTPYWLFGDTQWEAFADDPGQGLSASRMQQYFTLRAGQGFNYVHAEIIGLVRSSNIDARGQEQPAFYDYRAETINPAYFNEVDTRLRQANALGLTMGLFLMEPYVTPASSIDSAFRYDNTCWMSFPNEAARWRYARYVVARYSAFNVLFLITTEWGPNPKPIDHDTRVAMFNRIGTEIQNHDPHHRLLGIHDDNGTLPNAFYGKASRWNTLGQYGQYSGSDYEWPWCDGCTPPDDAHCQGRVATPKNRQTLHGFFTQRANGSRRAWWQLVPHDELVSSRPNPGDGSPGYAYCLADSGQSYIVYTENTTATDLVLSGSSNATYRVTRFDPRTANRTLVKTSVKNGTTITLLSPDTEDWAYEVQKN